MLTRLRKKIKNKLQKKTSKKKINIWNIILWINIIGNIPLSLENVKNNWWRIISYFIFLLDEIFSADYKKMLLNYELDSEEFKEFRENHLKNYQFNISSASLLALLINSISNLYTGFNYITNRTSEIELEYSEKKKVKGGNVYSLMLNNENIKYIFNFNMFGVISFIFKGWIPFLSTYEP